MREVETEDALERIIDELPRKPFLAGEDGVSMSLAGVQSKLAVRVLEGGRITGARTSRGAIAAPSRAVASASGNTQSRVPVMRNQRPAGWAGPVR